MVPLRGLSQQDQAPSNDMSRLPVVEVVNDFLTKTGCASVMSGHSACRDQMEHYGVIPDRHLLSQEASRLGMRVTRVLSCFEINSA